MWDGPENSFYTWQTSFWHYGRAWFPVNSYASPWGNTAEAYAEIGELKARIAELEACLHSIHETGNFNHMGVK